MAQAFADRPEGVAICFGLIAGACLFIFNAIFNLTTVEREGVVPVALSYYLSAAACVGLAVWIWRRQAERTGGLEAAVLIALSLFAFNIIWTEHRWPGLSDGPTGYMVILTCVSGSLLRRGSVLTAFLLVTNVVWLIVISQGSGIDESARVQHSLVVISVVTAFISFVVLKGERHRQAGLTDGLVRQVRHDLLTGVLSRRGLLEALAAGSGSHGTPAWCVYVDIDGFKELNDEFGHARGDHALVAVGTALTDTTDPDCLIARWGGDEFVVLGAGPAPDEVELESELNHVLSSGSAGCRVSIGLATTASEVMARAALPTPTGPVSAIEELIHEADHRMYRRRQQRRGLDSVGDFATAARR